MQHTPLYNSAEDTQKICENIIEFIENQNNGLLYVVDRLNQENWSPEGIVKLTPTANTAQMMSTKSLQQMSSDPGPGGSPSITPSLIDSMNQASPKMISENISR